MMKKLILTITIVLGLSICSFANDGGGLFLRGASSDVHYGSNFNRDGVTPMLPGQHNLETDQPAPLGSGLVALVSLGAIYALCRKKEND